MSNRLLDRIAALNFNVIRVVHEHPLQAYKYLNGGVVKVVFSTSLQKIIKSKDDEESVVIELKRQFNGRISEQCVNQTAFFNYKNLKLSWVIQPVLKSDESILSEDVFDTKNNVYLIIINTARALKKIHTNRIVRVKKRRKNHE